MGYQLYARWYQGAVTVDGEGRVFVCDRASHRVQVRGEINAPPLQHQYKVYQKRL